MLFLFLIGLDHIDGVGSSVSAASIGGYLGRPACLIGDCLRSQNLYLRVRKIRAVLDTYQDIIEHDAPVMSQILPDHNEHGTFERHGKEDVISKVSDPHFTNLVQRSGSNEKSMLIR